MKYIAKKQWRGYKPGDVVDPEDVLNLMQSHKTFEDQVIIEKVSDSQVQAPQSVDDSKSKFDVNGDGKVDLKDIRDVVLEAASQSIDKVKEIFGR